MKLQNYCILDPGYDWPVTVIWNDPSITRPLLLTEKLKDTGTVDRSTRVKAERKHKIWRGALSPMNLILGLSKQ